MGIRKSSMTKPRRLLLVVSVLAIIVLGFLLILREWPVVLGQWIGLEQAQRISIEAKEGPARRDMAIQAETESVATPAISDKERNEIATVTASARVMLRRIEERNAEVLRTSEDEAGRRKATFLRLHPPSKEQLDSVFDALTKQSDAYPQGSPSASEFAKQATTLIHEFGMYDKPGRILMHSHSASSSEESLSLVQFDEPSAEVKVLDNGTIDLKSGTTEFIQHKDWNDPNSPSRQRYGYLFKDK